VNPVGIRPAVGGVGAGASLPGSDSAAINLQLRFRELSHIIAAVLEFSDGLRCRSSAYSKPTARRAASGAANASARGGRRADPAAKEFLMSNFIDMLSGEYFFAPSPAFLASL
jgi:hypothetical protein